MATIIIHPPSKLKASQTLLLSVRKKEMELEAQQARDLRQEKERRKQRLLLLLQDLWKERQTQKVAALREECEYAMRCIAQAHNAAALIVQNQEARKLELRKQAKINKQLAALRYKNALQNERIRKEQVLKQQFFAERRKNVKELAAHHERKFRRSATHKTNRKAVSGNSASQDICSRFAEQRKTLTCLQPSDYKYTFLHSQLFMDEVDANSSLRHDKPDAWKAAEIQRQVMAQNRIAKMEMKDIMDKRKALRGQLAGSKMMIAQKLQQLREEETKIERAEKEDNKRTGMIEEIVNIHVKGVENPQVSQVENHDTSIDFNSVLEKSDWNESIDSGVNLGGEGIKKGDKLQDAFKYKKKIISEENSVEGLRVDDENEAKMTIHYAHHKFPKKGISPT